MCIRPISDTTSSPVSRIGQRWRTEMETKLRRIRNSRAVKLWELRRDPCATHNDNLAH